MFRGISLFVFMSFNNYLFFVNYNNAGGGNKKNHCKSRCRKTGKTTDKKGAAQNCPSNISQQS